MKLNMKALVVWAAALTVAQKTSSNGTVLSIEVGNDTVKVNDGESHIFTAKQATEFDALMLKHGIIVPQDCFKVPFYKKGILIEVIGGVTIATIVGVTAYKLFGPERVITAANAAVDASTAAAEAVVNATV